MAAGLVFTVLNMLQGHGVVLPATDVADEVYGPNRKPRRYRWHADGCSMQQTVLYPRCQTTQLANIRPHRSRCAHDRLLYRPSAEPGQRCRDVYSFMRLDGDLAIGKFRRVVQESAFAGSGVMGNKTKSVRDCPGTQRNSQRETVQGRYPLLGSRRKIEANSQSARGRAGRRRGDRDFQFMRFQGTGPRTPS